VAISRGIDAVSVGTEQSPGADGDEADPSLAILEEYDKLVPWYRDPWHGSRVLLAAAIGLWLGYMLMGHRAFFYGTHTLAITALAALAALDLLVVWRTRLLVRRVERAVGEIQPPGGGQPSASDATQGPASLGRAGHSA